MQAYVVLSNLFTERLVRERGLQKKLYCDVDLNTRHDCMAEKPVMVADVRVTHVE